MFIWKTFFTCVFDVGAPCLYFKVQSFSLLVCHCDVITHTLRRSPQGRSCQLEADIIVGIFLLQIWCKLHVLIVPTWMIMVEWKLSTVWCQESWLAMPPNMAPLVHSGVANHGCWCQTVNNSYIPNHHLLTNMLCPFLHEAIFPQGTFDIS